MPTLDLTSELVGRVDRWGAQFPTARMSALAELPGNPYGVEIRSLGEEIACTIRHPLLRGKNRVIAFTTDDLPRLDGLVQFYQEAGLRFTLSVSHGRTTPELFRRLVLAGLWTAGSGATPILDPQAHKYRETESVPSAGIHVRQSGTEEREVYLDLFQHAFRHRDERDPEYRAVHWPEDSLPGSPRYIAEIDGLPVSMASFPIVNRYRLHENSGSGRGVSRARRADGVDRPSDRRCASSWL